MFTDYEIDVLLSEEERELPLSYVLAEDDLYEI